MAERGYDSWSSWVVLLQCNNHHTMQRLPLPTSAGSLWNLSSLTARGPEEKMRCYPDVSLCRLLCIWLTLACCQGKPVTIGQVRADIKSLAKTMITRIQHQQFPAVTTRIIGLEFIPEGLPALNLRAMGKTLETFDQVLNNLPLHEPLNQLPYDLENLWSLLRLLSTQLRCPGVEHSVINLVQSQKNLLAVSPYTSTAVTLHRLQNILQSIANAANYMQQC